MKPLHEETWLLLGSTKEHFDLTKRIAHICRDVTKGACIDEICIHDIVATFAQFGFHVVRAEELSQLQQDCGRMGGALSKAKALIDYVESLTWEDDEFLHDRRFLEAASAVESALQPSSEKWVRASEMEALGSQLSDLSRKVGLAEGKLLASENFSLIEGWKSRAQAAEERVKELEEAIKPAVELRPDAEELLLALNAEFYSGPLAHADAFRILPRIAEALKAIRNLNQSTLVKEKEKLG